MKNEIYESRISTARWLIYDVPGNIGWILYIVCLIRLLRQGVTVYSVLALLPAILMLVGLAEIIRERIQKLDRVLPKHRLYCGFGSLTLGGLLGIPVSLAGLFFFDGGGRALLMLAGAVLCAVFAWLILREYHKSEGDGRR